MLKFNFQSISRLNNTHIVQDYLNNTELQQESFMIKLINSRVLWLLKESQPQGYSTFKIIYLKAVFLKVDMYMMWGRQEFKRGKTQIIKEKRQINLTILKCKAFIRDKTMVHLLQKHLEFCLKCVNSWTPPKTLQLNKISK